MLRKSLMILLAGALFVGLSAVVMAQKAEKGAKGGDPLLTRALAGLNLTADQKAKIDPLVAEYEGKVKEAKGKEKMELRKSVMDQICPLLTEEQKPKFEEAMKPRAGGKKQKEGGEAK